MSAGHIDWSQVRLRLAKSEQALSQTLSVDETRKEKMLRKRAEDLASRRPKTLEKTGATPVLVFYLGKERYAIELRELREVLPWARCIPAPGAPSEIAGVMGVRGELRTVWDLARLLELPRSQPDAGGYVLLLRKGGSEIGLRVDQTEGRQEIESEKWIPLLEGEGSPAARCLKGMTAERVLLLDVERILEPILSEEVVWSDRQKRTKE